MASKSKSKARTYKSKTKPRKYQFHWWHAAIAVAAIALVGILVIRFSNASASNTMNCDQNPSPCVGEIDSGNPQFTAYNKVLRASSGDAAMYEPASNIFGQDNGVHQSATINVCWTLEGAFGYPPQGVEYQLVVSTVDGQLTPITDRIYADGTFQKCANNVWIGEPGNNSTSIAYGLRTKGGTMWLAQVTRQTVAVSGGSEPPNPVYKPGGTTGNPPEPTCDAACQNAKKYAEAIKAAELRNKPVGSVDSFTCGIPHPTLNGWALDPTHPNQPTQVDVYLDGQAGSGASGVPGIVANMPREPAVGMHGFAFQVPSSWLDGNNHTAYVYAMSTDRARSTEIGHLNFRCEQPPDGRVDNVICNSNSQTVQGWAADPSDRNKAIQVHFYFDHPAGQGAGFPGTVADQSRPDVANAGWGNGNHGFNFQIPTQYLDGRTHRLYVYAIGIDRNGSPSDNSWLNADGRWGLFSCRK